MSNIIGAVKLLLEIILITVGGFSIILSIKYFTSSHIVLGAVFILIFIGSAACLSWVDDTF